MRVVTVPLMGVDNAPIHMAREVTNTPFPQGLVLVLELHWEQFKAFPLHKHRFSTEKGLLCHFVMGFISGPNKADASCSLPELQSSSFSRSN